MPKKVDEQEVFRRRRLAAIGGGILLVVVVILLIFLLLPDSQSSSNLPTETATSKPDITLTTGPSGVSATPQAPTRISNPAIPAGTPTCSDSDIAVTVSTDKPQYKLGEKPVFKAIITNAGGNSCARNIGTGMEQFIVSDLSGNRIWSNFDCHLQAGFQQQLLAPGQQIGFNIQWQALNSLPHCAPEANKPVPAGQYQVVAVLNTVESKPQTFNING